MYKILSIFGTRPEAIKMAPIIKELQKYSEKVDSIVCVSAQHREMLDQVLDFFKIKPHYDLNLMEQRQTLTGLTIKVIKEIEPIIKDVAPDWLLLQGDTTTVMAVSLVAFYLGIRVGHIEAGLRTNNKRAPFPEEINRRITSVIADIHFAPTEHARQSLLSEGIPNHSIVVTGNTSIDAVLQVVDIIHEFPPKLPDGLVEAINGKRMILVTGHRRENFEAGLKEICLALKELVIKFSDICVVYPVHLNPEVRETVYKILYNINRIHLIDPLPYAPFIWLMDKAYFILTDSGGIQEEAPALGKPVLVLREVTERPEGISVGNAFLVGTKQDEIIRQSEDLLCNSNRYAQMSKINNPYGDGLAASRIVKTILNSEYV